MSFIVIRIIFVTPQHNFFHYHFCEIFSKTYIFFMNLKLPDDCASSNIKILTLIFFRCNAGGELQSQNLFIVNVFLSQTTIECTVLYVWRWTVYYKNIKSYLPSFHCGDDQWIQVLILRRSVKRIPTFHLCRHLEIINKIFLISLYYIHMSLHIKRIQFLMPIFIYMIWREWKRRNIEHFLNYKHIYFYIRSELNIKIETKVL